MIVKETFYQRYQKRKDCIFVLISEKKKENIDLYENKKFEKGSFKPSEHILQFFCHPTMVCAIIRHSLSSCCPGFLKNEVGNSDTY